MSAAPKDDAASPLEGLSSILRQFAPKHNARQGAALMMWANEVEAAIDHIRVAPIIVGEQLQQIALQAGFTYGQVGDERWIEGTPAQAMRFVAMVFASIEIREILPAGTPLGAEQHSQVFEDAIFAHYQRIKAGGWANKDEGDFSRESLFHLQANGQYGVASIEAAWWGWQMRERAQKAGPKLEDQVWLG
jgi:hypothetical protein